MVVLGFQAVNAWLYLGRSGDLERNQATYVLDTAPAGIYRWDRYPVEEYPTLDRYLAEHYEPLGSVREVRVFRRRGCAAFPPAENPR